MGRGPTQDELDRALLADEARRALFVLAPVEDVELRGLFEELVELPSLDLSLVLPLPGLLSPALARLLDAVGAEDLDAADDALPDALALVDSVATRAALARAVLRLRDEGRIRPRLAALAVRNLRDQGSLLSASLIHAAAIAAGVTRTPGGLLLTAA